MAETQINYVEALTERDIEFGKRVWQALRKNKKFPVSAVFWLLQPEASEWQLRIASTKVDELGPRDAYLELANVTRTVPANDAQLLKIQLMSPKHRLCQAMHEIFGQTASVEGVRLGNTQVGNVFISGAYLYEVR